MFHLGKLSGDEVRLKHASLSRKGKRRCLDRNRNRRERTDQWASIQQWTLWPDLHYGDLTLDSSELFKSNEWQFHIIGIMRRLADYYLNKAPTLDEMKKAHRKFIRDYKIGYPIDVIQLPLLDLIEPGQQAN